MAENKSLVQARKYNFRWAITVIIPVIFTWCFLSVTDIIFTGINVGLTPAKVFSVISSSALISIPLLFFSARLRKYAAVILLSFFVLFVFADTLHLRYFGTILSFWELKEIRQLPGIMPAIGGIILLKDLWLLFLVCAIIIFARFCPLPQQVKAPPLRLILAWYAAVFLFFSSVSFYCYDSLAQEWKLPLISRFCSPTFYLERRGLIGAHLDDLMLLTWELTVKRVATEAEKREIKEILLSRQAKRDISGSLYGAARGKNVIFIQVESLQPWVINKRVNSQEITPFLNQLSRKALYYPWIFDQTFNGRSSDADFAALNSLYPLGFGSLAFRRPYDDFVALPGLLRDAGYTTFSSSGYPRAFWNIGILHCGFGIQKSLFAEELGREEVFPDGYISDGYFLARIIPELTRLPQPFFALLTTISSHVPFDIPEEYHFLKIQGSCGRPFKDYLQSISYVDRCLQGFFGDLEKSGLAQNSMIVIYGDHDWGFLASEDLFEFLGYQNPQTAIEALLDRVPLFIVLPEPALNADTSVIGGQIDIAPTVLYLLGMRQPLCFLGEPLFTKPGRAIITNPWGSVVTDKVIFFNTSSLTSANRCFSFRTARPLTEQACGGIEEEGVKELRMSQVIVLYDLMRKICAR